VPAISRRFDLNCKFKVQQNNKTVTGLNHTTNPDPNHNP